MDWLRCRQRSSATVVLWLRPFLRTGRDELRAYLIERGIAWSDDPSNDDGQVLTASECARRLPQLAELGLTVDALADTARRMRRAREALDAQVVEWGERYVEFDAGEVRMAHPLLTEAPSEISLRLLKNALCWVATAPYPPRFDGLARVHEAAAKGENSTLHGCLILSETRRRGGGFRHHRDARAKGAGRRHRRNRSALGWTVAP